MRIRLLPHRKYKVRGKDLYADLPVLDYEAALGAEVQVPSLGGPVWLKIPPGTQGDTQMRLKGKGFASKEGKGDLYFNIKIVIPSGLSDREKELLELLRASREKGGGDDPRRDLLP